MKIRVACDGGFKSLAGRVSDNERRGRLDSRYDVLLATARAIFEELKWGSLMT